ncbi:RagB/SusD family nutrient uptake outer membrane protein [Sphingobacterium paucimobilis]|uniref:Carbohydrate-binding protein SusD n=1 Tax=Sphingobacterium paucimobilis HER1398 TaxID=1346330 RepID=U2J1F1_9SPHI|nr:RagB/SusD family nutrient uptake outer membrane protein [Sphingobacterium paucimobilis]ERJ58804.1 hypothetical protein M472_08485 [Sphingobacterium paucimobilis HER1398]
MKKVNLIISFSFIIAILFGGCSKWLVIDEPRDAIAQVKMFATEKQAENALMGLYNYLIHGTSGNNISSSIFSGGLTTLAGARSSYEIVQSDLGSSGMPVLWQLNKENADQMWTSAYRAIFLANATIEGILKSESTELRDSVKRQFIAEAKFWRAFSHLSLLQFFGDVPLVLTTDFNQTRTYRRTPQDQVYNQILIDLQEAERNLPRVFAAGSGQRVRVNAWASLALQARAYLYRKDYPNALLKANQVIQASELFNLEDLSNVFKANNSEAILQLLPTNNYSDLLNATPEGIVLLPNPINTGGAYYRLSDNLLASFQPDDQRKNIWVGHTDRTASQLPSPTPVYYPFKYKQGRHNGALGAPSPEYYMVLRLAEMYLIRAEAALIDPSGDIAAARTDLNRIRDRAGLDDLPLTLDRQGLIASLWQERQVEFFVEWGHYWIDICRSGRAKALLAQYPVNSPWLGDWQLLYPIPEEEIRNNKNLIQNEGYDQVR